MPGVPGEVPEFDFTGELAAALEHAPYVQLTDSGKTDVGRIMGYRARADRLSGYPDNRLIFHTGGRGAPNQVLTRNRDAYPSLLMQASDVFSEHMPHEAEAAELLGTDGPTEIDVQKSLVHELEHADAVQRVSPGALVDYGVQVMLWSRDGDRSVPVMEPSISILGWLRKIDLAYVSVAPDEPSEGDLEAINALGYGSPEEVVERFEASARIWPHALRVLNLMNRGTGMLMRRVSSAQKPAARIHAEAM